MTFKKFRVLIRGQFRNNGCTEALKFNPQKIYEFHCIKKITYQGGISKEMSVFSC